VEGFALHFRNLYEFLYEDKKGGYVTAEHFCRRGIWKRVRPPLPPIIKDAKNRANEEIAHLTKNRKPRKPDRTPWPFMEIAGAIRPILESLAANSVEGRLSPRVLQSIELNPGPMDPNKRMGIGPEGPVAPCEMTPVGITGTSRSYSDEEAPPIGRT
jgi:hypothetical protein